jgi:hypothetical protein
VTYTYDTDELATRFIYHRPTGDQPAKYEQIRDAVHSVADLIGELCPPSREQSLAWTALEEAVMWANAAIARREHPDDAVYVEASPDEEPDP